MVLYVPVEVFADTFITMLTQADMNNLRCVNVYWRDVVSKIDALQKAKASEMAAQLAKRSGQLAVERNIPHDEATAHLLSLMRQGWAAK